MHILQKAGVAAGPVLNAKELLEDPHFNERGFYERVTRDEVGTHPYPGSPIRLSKTPARIRMPAPCLGEHNEYILSEIAGLSREEIQELEDEQVIGTRPLNM
jgi:crotonobetainyl-CoA:carnitine CoA-transferase CaiB-like acyl-CoA transferase